MSRLLPCLLLVGLAGCSSSASHPMAPVTGTVLFNGQPVTGATVVFSPVAKDTKDRPGPPSFGPLDASGKFTLATANEGSGAVVGWHHVSVGYPDPGPNQGCLPADYKLEVKPGPNTFQLDLQPKPPDMD